MATTYKKIKYNNNPVQVQSAIEDGTGNNIASTYATQASLSNYATTGDVSAIEDLIPAQATSSNQLADKSFVNSSIATNTANFIGTFSNVTALEEYSGTVTNNDYAFVTNQVLSTDYASLTALNLVDKTTLTNFDYGWVENGSKFDLYRFDIVNQEWVLRVQNTDKNEVTLNTAYNRYKANVVNNTTTWEYEYTLNNSSFTAQQWASINSGITSTLAGKITTNENAILTLDGNKLNKSNSNQDGYITLYGVASSGNTQNMYPASYNTVADAIPFRDSDGQIKVPTTPTDNNHATSKSYVDNSIVTTQTEIAKFFVDNPSFKYNGNPVYLQDIAGKNLTDTDVQSYLTALVTKFPSFNNNQISLVPYTSTRWAVLQSTNMQTYTLWYILPDQGAIYHLAPNTSYQFVETFDYLLDGLTKQDKITSTNKLDYSLISNTPTIPTQASQVNALPDSTKYGASLSVSGTSVQLKDQDGNNLGSAITTQDTNTWRAIKVNGTQKLGTGTNTNDLDLVAGNNVSLSESSGAVTISATDTTYSSLSASQGGTDVSLVTTGEKYTWNSKSDFSGAYNDLSGKPTLGTQATFSLSGTTLTITTL